MASKTNSKVKDLKAYKQEVLKALHSINPEAAEEFMLDDTLKEIARIQAEIKSIKEK